VRAATVRDARGLDASEDRVELGVRHAEAEVMVLEALAVGEIERQTVIDEDGHELAEGFGRRHVEQLRQPLGRGVLVA